MYACMSAFMSHQCIHEPKTLCGRPAGQSRRDPRAAMGQTAQQQQQQQQQQVPAPAPAAMAGDGALPEGNTAALAAQLAAGGDSAMRLQQILANLPMVRAHASLQPFSTFSTCTAA